MKVAYILDYFPVLSETFIVREILELKKKHLNVLIYARENTSNHKYNEVTHSDTMSLMKDVRYFSSLMNGIRLQRWKQVIMDHLFFALRKPFNYLDTFLFSLRNGREIFVKFVFSASYARQLKSAGIAHMHVHFALDACTYAMLISMVSGIPYSFSVHAHDIFVPDFADLLEEKFNNAKFAVCISEFNKKFVLNKYSSINKDKIKIIHCGLDLLAFVPKEKNVNKKFTILTTGRLVEHKGFKYLIKACKQLIDENDLDFVCNIIGEGDERRDLEELISGNNLVDVVHLLGPMEQLDVINLLKSADVFVLPCVTEEEGMQDGIPVSLMEAMAMEIPVISTIVSGVPELILDNSGILVKQKDVNALSLAIKEIMKMSAGERELMGQRGRVIIEKSFNIEKEAGELAKLISD